MHEMSLMSTILARAEQALAPYRVKQVNSITVQAGVLANILPAAFDFAFEALSEGTVFEGAKMISEARAIEARCNECAKQFTKMDLPLICPHCRSKQVQITAGDEVLLASIDFDEEGATDED